MHDYTDYLYTEPLQQRNADIERFKHLAKKDTSKQTKEETAQFLVLTNRLFYNSFPATLIEEQRMRWMHFLTIQLDDSFIPEALSGTSDPAHEELINDIANALEMGESLKDFKLNKLADQHPEVPFYTLASVVEMELNQKDPAKILRRINEVRTIYPNIRLFALLNDQYRAINDKDGLIINDLLINQSSLMALMGQRTSIHPIEFYVAHAALYEYLVRKEDYLNTDAFLFASNELFPEQEHVLIDKALLFEFSKLDYCIENYAPELV